MPFVAEPHKTIPSNRPQVIAASLILLALVAGIVGTSVGLYQAMQANKEAERNLAFARKGNEIPGSVFAGLDQSGENYKSLSELSEMLLKNLRKAVKEPDTSAIGDPVEVAAMQNTLGMLREDDEVLEPSAGKGDLADAVTRYCLQHDIETSLTSIETNFELCQILELNGYQTFRSDFMAVQGTVDKIVMNPPFESEAPDDFCKTKSRLAFSHFQNPMPSLWWTTPPIRLRATLYRMPIKDHPVRRTQRPLRGLFGQARPPAPRKHLQQCRRNRKAHFTISEDWFRRTERPTTHAT